MTTVKELSEQLGVSKSAILKYCKTELGIKTEPRKALQLDANQTAVVCSYFGDSVTASHLVKHSGTGNQSADNNTSQSTDNCSSDTQVLQQLQIENARLEERVAGLERENALLRERIEQADAALEREQRRAGGFWARLGQKLLGSGD